MELRGCLAHTCLARNLLGCPGESWPLRKADGLGGQSRAGTQVSLIIHCSCSSAGGSWHWAALALFPAGQLWDLLSEVITITTTTLHAGAFLPRNSTFVRWRHNLINPPCVEVGGLPGGAGEQILLMFVFKAGGIRRGSGKRKRKRFLCQER